MIFRHLFFDSEALSLSSHGNVVIDEVFIARERRWSRRPLSLCRVCLSSQSSILASCGIQIFEAERLAYVCDSVNYVLTSSVQLSPIMTSRSSSQLLRLRLEVDREDLRRSEDGLN